MLDISMIIFVLALIGISVMFVRQYKKLKVDGELDKEFPTRDFSYESFQTFNKKLWQMWLMVIHGTAIVGTKAWAHTTHHTTKVLRKGLKKIEDRIIKSEKKNSDGTPREQSVFLTTIKTYKHEIRKLERRSEDELPRPRENSSPVDLSAEDNKIE